MGGPAELLLSICKIYRAVFGYLTTAWARKRVLRTKEVKFRSHSKNHARSIGVSIEAVLFRHPYSK